MYTGSVENTNSKQDRVGTGIHWKLCKEAGFKHANKNGMSVKQNLSEKIKQDQGMSGHWD